MNTVPLFLDEIFDLAKKTLLINGCDQENASILADTIMRAERDGSVSHGLFRLPAYIAGLNSKKIDIVPKEYPKEALDIFLKEFNIRYRNIPFQDERKFLGNQWLVKNNIWIRNRLLMTVSPRADLCSYFKLYKDRREKNICKFISIGRSSIFALKSDIELIQSL